MADFLAMYAEIIASGQYPYNSLFKGRIPGLAQSTDKDEDTAIYLCQVRRDLDEIDEKRDAALADGFIPVKSFDQVVKCEALIDYGFYSQGTGWRELKNVTLKGHIAVPKGKRTLGYTVHQNVLIKVAK